jgi:RNA polymerase primary sigma factor
VEVGELVIDEWASRVAEDLVAEAETARLFEALTRLPERARRVLVRRHGLDGRDPATLRELAEELVISRERARQLQREAERRLRISRRAASPGALAPTDPRGQQTANKGG